MNDSNMELRATCMRAALDALAMKGPQAGNGQFFMRTAEPSQYLSGVRLRLAEAALAELNATGKPMDAASLSLLVEKRIATLLSGAMTQH